MGRPIKKIFIGERGAGNAGGEGVASVTVVAGDSAGFVDLEPLIIPAPDLVGGVQAVGHILVAAGAVDSVVMTVVGSGYTSVPTPITVDTVAGTETTLGLTAVLTTTGAAVIAASAYVTGNDLSADMIAQKGDITYKVTTTEGTLECALVAAVPSAVGEMAIVATDSTGNTYWVTKLHNRTVRLVQNVENTTFEFDAGSVVGWADVAVLNKSVKITS